MRCKVFLILCVIIVVGWGLVYSESKDVDYRGVSFIQITSKNNVFKVKTRFRGAKESDGIIVRKDEAINNINIIFNPLDKSLVIHGEINGDRILETILNKGDIEDEKINRAFIGK